MKRKVKWIFLAVIAAVSVGAYAAVILKPVNAQAERAEKGNMESHFTVSASILPVSGRVLGSSSAGTVAKLPFQPGMEVKEGEIILTTDSASQTALDIQREQLKQQLENARQEYERLYGENGSAIAALTAAESEYRLAKLNYDNGLVLEQQGGFIARTDLDALKTRMELAYQKYTQAKEDNSEARRTYFKDQIASCEKQLELLDNTVNPGAVTMPYDGVLWEVYAEEGEYLSPNQPVAKVYRPQEMKLSASVLSENAYALTPGLVAEVIYADGTKGEAEVSFISKTAEKQISSIGLEENRCTVELKPLSLPEYAGAGQTADVSFTVVKAEGVYSVPAAAVMPQESGSAVYLIKNGRAVSVPVETGRREGGRVEILSGLEEGDIVASDPYNDNVEKNGRVTAVLNE